VTFASAVGWARCTLTTARRVPSCSQNHRIVVCYTIQARSSSNSTHSSRPSPPSPRLHTRLSPRSIPLHPEDSHTRALYRPRGCTVRLLHPKAALKDRVKGIRPLNISHISRHPPRFCPGAQSINMLDLHQGLSTEHPISPSILLCFPKTSTHCSDHQARYFSLFNSHGPQRDIFN